MVQAKKRKEEGAVKYAEKRRQEEGEDAVPKVRSHLASDRLDSIGYNSATSSAKSTLSRWRSSSVQCLHVDIVERNSRQCDDTQTSRGESLKGAPWRRLWRPWQHLHGMRW